MITDEARMVPAEPMERLVRSLNEELKRTATHVGQLIRERNVIEAERDSYRTVVDAAKAWRNQCAEYDRVASTNSITDLVDARRRLFTAVEALSTRETPK